MKVLFLGNSHTYFNDMPQIFANLCKARGKKAITLTCKEEKLAYYAKFGFADHGVAGSTHGGALWYNMVCEL